MQPLTDFLLEEFRGLDYSVEMAFDVTKTLSVFRAFYEEMGRKYSEYTDETIRQCLGEISNEHADVCPLCSAFRGADHAPQVRGFIAEILSFSDKIKVSCGWDEGIYLAQNIGSGNRILQDRLQKVSRLLGSSPPI